MWHVTVLSLSSSHHLPYAAPSRAVVGAQVTGAIERHLPSLQALFKGVAAHDDHGMQSRPTHGLHSPHCIIRALSSLHGVLDASLRVNAGMEGKHLDVLVELTEWRMLMRGLNLIGKDLSLRDATLSFVRTCPLPTAAS